MRTIAILFAGLLVAGCTKYEFDVVEPADLAAHVGRDRSVRLERPPLAYRLQSAEGRLVMWIDNPTDDTVELLGGQSFVVSPDGQSRPLADMAIAPRSFVKLILPPLRAYEHTSPRIGIGIGVIANGDPDEVSPVYFNAASADPAAWWEWKGESSVRMKLTFRRGGSTFSHAFVFQRVKAG